MAERAIISDSPHENRFFGILDDAMLACIRPFRICADYVFSSVILTTKERETWFLKVPEYLTFWPLALLGALMALPFACVALFVWILIQHKRKSYRYSYVDGVRSCPKTTYGITTANLCLLPECASRFNNLFRTSWRAKEIGRRIVHQQLRYYNNARLNEKRSTTYAHNDHERPDVSEFRHEISETFPVMDFLLVQEAFDLGYTQELVMSLHSVFPYIVYDVGYTSFTSNMYTCNSGMLLASKYPIEKVQFSWFKHSCYQCRFASKGVLQVKVHLATLKDGRNIVGYIFNTHLQSYEGDLRIQEKQLNELLRWTEQFRRTTINKNDVVAFDLLGGDFNLDNMSPAHNETRKHQLFKSYVDACCVKPGNDYEWTVGTEMRQIPLHEPEISTPEGLKVALEDPQRRQYYILDADVQTATMESLRTMAKTDEDGNILLSPTGGRRRVDFILYRNVHDDASSEVTPLKVTAYNTVTQLASLTDHLPVSITFTVDLERFSKKPRGIVRKRALASSVKQECEFLAPRTTGFNLGL